MHPYRSLPARAHDAQPEGHSLGLALGVLTSVSLVQLVTAYHHAGVFAVQTVTGAAFFAAGLIGLAKRASWS
jgi:FtsH-binding integral membrane protein